jgi:hypothetical protein
MAEPPSDFTENILFYLGNAPKPPTITQPTALDEVRKHDIEDYLSSEDPFSSSPDARHSPSPAHPRSDRPVAGSLPRSKAASSQKPHVIEDPRESETVKALENSLRLLRTELESVRRQSSFDVHNLRAEVEQESEQTRTQRRELDRMMQENERLRQQNQDLERLRFENGQIKARQDSQYLELEKAQAENVQLKQQHAVALGKLTVTLEKLTLDNEQLKTQHNHDQEQILKKSLHGLELERLNSENVRLSKTLTESTQSAKLAIQNLDLQREAQIQALKDEHKMLLQTKLAQADMQASQLEEQASDAQEVAEQRTAAIRGLQAQVAELKNQVVLANDRAEDVEKEKAADFAKLEVLVASCERKEERITRFKMKVTEIGKKNLDLAKEINVLRRQLSALKIESDTAQKTQQKELSHLRHECDGRGKLLMQYWGKIECGAALHGKAQPYKYIVEHK